jgi:hypothetical protein
MLKFGIIDLIWVQWALTYAGLFGVWESVFTLLNLEKENVSKYANSSHFFKVNYHVFITSFINSLAKTK